MTSDDAFVLWFSDLSRSDVDVVGGKNASLGEMIGRLREAGIKVPGGFATTAAAYWRFLDAGKLKDRLAENLAKLKDDASNLAAVGKAVREMILEAELPGALAESITSAYHEMASRTGHEVASVAVRSSATAEDLPEASFAGQLETFLTTAIAELLAKAQKSGTHTGICGQAPSDHPEFARFLVEHGIDSISVSPDSFLAVKRVVAEAERERDAGPGRRPRQAGAVAG